MENKEFFIDKSTNRLAADIKVKDNKDLTSLIGKRIYAVEWFPVHTPEHYETKHDDGDYLVITFTDGVKLRLNGNYHEAYTGNSIGEYPAYLDAYVQEPEGFNGPGMYEALIKSKQSTGDLQELYGFTFGGEYRDIPTRLFRFQCDSLEHAKSLLNLDEVEYVKWISKKVGFDYDNE